MEPILHLSIAVADLDAARAFYADVLGCDVGRVREGFVDVWFFGMQITLQARPDQVLTPEQASVLHFGVTVAGDELVGLLERARAADVDWVHELTVDHAGTSREQSKAKLRDPSGNVIELKAYADPTVALELLGLAEA
jgi:extradiol dioxygenase family protein